MQGFAPRKHPRQACSLDCIAKLRFAFQTAPAGRCFKKAAAAASYSRRQPQNTKLLLPTNTAAATTTLLPAKKEAPHSRRLRLQSKNFCLQGLFPNACSIHAFISAASVLKSFSKTTSISSTLCRPSFM